MARRTRPTKATNPRDLAIERGQGDEPTYVNLSDKLVVGVRLCNMESMISLGILPEPLMEAAIQLGKKNTTERSVVDFKESAALQDVLCAAIIEDPKWSTLDEVAENGNKPPAGTLWLGMLTDEEIGGCFHMVYKGLDSWETFREKRESSAAVEAGDGDGSEAKRPNLVVVGDPD